MKQFIQDAEPEMRRDLSTLIQTLKHIVILEGDQQRMVSLILKWQQKDRLSPNIDRTQTPLFDHFLSLSKMTSYSARSARNAWIEESASIFDGLFYTLTGGHRQEFQRVLASSAAEATSGPGIERAENEWKGMGRQIGLGGYGIVQGMGLSLAGAFDSATQTATGAAQSVLSMTGSHYQLAAPLALTPFISQSYDQLTPQVRQTLGANASNDVHVFGMTGNQFGKIGGQGVGQLMMSGFGKAAQATKYVQALNKGAAVLQATQAVDASLRHLTDLIVARHEKDPNATPATYLLDDDILSEMCVTLDAVADLGVSLLGGNKTKKTAALRQVLRKMHLAARFGKDVVTAASTADTLIARAEVLYQSHPNISAMDIVTDPTILEALVAFVGSSSDAAQVGSGASRQAQKLGKWPHRIKTSADFIAPVFQARQALAEMSDQALALHRHDPHYKDALLLVDAGMQSHMLDVLSSAGMIASAGGSRSRPVLRLLAAHTENIVRQGRKGVAFEARHGTSMMAQSVLDRFKSTASVVTHLLGSKAQSAVQRMLPHFGGDGTKPLTASTLPGDHPAPAKSVADGGMTGPFYPHPGMLPYASAEAALNDSGNVAVYVNGVQTPLKRHLLAAQELAQQIGKPVVGIYNASGTTAQDFGQCATDKFGILGMGKRNAAVGTLAGVIRRHGSLTAKNGGLDLYAHSQGSIIVSEAIRQAKGEGRDVRGLDVTTFGNAAWSRPAGVRGYHNYSFDSDVISTLGGSTSAIGALLRTPFNRSNPLNPIMGGQGMVSTVDDTFTLHHRGALGRPHGVIADPQIGADGKPVLDKNGAAVLDSEDYYLKALPRFRAKEMATRARLSSLGPIAGPLAGEALNSAMMTRSLAATSFAFAKGAGSWLAGKTEKAYGAASGLAQRAYSGVSGLAQAGYGKAEQLVQGGYQGVGHAAAGAYSKSAGAVTSGYSRLDGGMRRLPSLPFLKPNTVWGALDSTFRGGGSRLDKGLRGGGAALDTGLRGAGRGLDRGWRGSAAALDSAARLGGGMADHSLRRIGSGVTQAGRSGANAADDYFDATNALQRKGTGDHPDVNPAALRSDLRKQSSGFLPDGNIRARLGGHLGFDPGGARLHTGPAAASASRNLNAEAFTIGNDVFFGEGRFDPHSPKGLGLIAHELTHVGQQTGTASSRACFFTQAGGDEMEREAQHTAEHVLANAGSRSGLFVEDYVREYEGEGGLTQADQQRLDRISVMALAEAQRMLASQGVRGRINADALDVSVEIDLGEMSDAKAARVWAGAITSQISARADTKAASSAAVQPAASPMVQRSWTPSILDDRSEPKKIDDALASKNSNDVHDIKDFSSASEQKKFDLISILLNQGWVGPIDESSLEKIWGSFGDNLPEVAGRAITLFNQSSERGAAVEDLAPAKAARDMFKEDVKSQALSFLAKNLAFVYAEAGRFGIIPTEDVNAAQLLAPPPPSPAQIQQMKDMQKAAQVIQSYQDFLPRMRKVLVGKDMYMQPFNPNQPPVEDYKFFGDQTNWEVAKQQWDKAVGNIASITNKYPTLFAAGNGGPVSMQQMRQTDPDTDPQAALRNISLLMNHAYKNIQTATRNIDGGYCDYRDLKPVYEQLFVGLPAASKTPWSDNFHQWVGRKDVRNHEQNEAWIKLALEAAGMIVWAASVVATGGAAAFLVVSGAGLAIQGVKTGLTANKYQALAAANQGQVRSDLGIVSKQDVDLLHMEDEQNKLELKVAVLMAFAGGIARGLSEAKAASAALESAPGAAPPKQFGRVVQPGERTFTYNSVENPGPLAKVSGGAGGSPPAANFRSGMYNATVLAEDKVFYRAGMKGGGRNAYGQWFTSESSASGAQVRDMLGVKSQWIDPKTGVLTGRSPLEASYKLLIPKGTTVYDGLVANLGPGNSGGAMQTYIPEPWNIKAVKVLSETPIP